MKTVDVEELCRCAAEMDDLYLNDPAEYYRRLREIGHDSAISVFKSEFEAQGRRSKFRIVK